MTNEQLRELAEALAGEIYQAQQPDHYPNSIDNLAFEEALTPYCTPADDAFAPRFKAIWIRLAADRIEKILQDTIFGPPGKEGALATSRPTNLQDKTNS